MHVKRPAHLTQERWAAWWKAKNNAGDGRPQYRNLSCPGCGGSYDVIDDGVPTDQGGLVGRANVSRPSLTSMSHSTGGRAGGQSVLLHGHALEVGALKVFFGDREANIVQRLPTSVQALTPVGRVFPLFSSGVGYFSLGETVLGSISGAQATVGSLLPFYLEGGTGLFQAGETLTGQTSGATGVFDSPPFHSTVTVRVENEWGGRSDGSSALLNHFQYL